MAFRAYAKEFALGNSVTALSLGLGASEALLVQSATVVNKDTVTRLLTMNLNSTGGSAADANLIEYQRTLPIKTSTNTALSGKTVAPGGALYAGSDAASVCTLQISGTVIPQAQ
jgi:hypothetical protein